MLDYVILGFLMKTELSGYDIKQMMSISIANFYDASFGSIYPSLKRMEDKGWITSKEVLDGGKYKKIHTINPSGRKEFLKWLEQPIRLPRDNHEHLVKIFFYGDLPGEKVQILVKRLIDDVQVEIRHLDEIGEKVGGMADFYQNATLQYGKDFYHFLIDWCEAFLRDQKNKAAEVCS